MLETGYVMLQIRLLIQTLAKLLTGRTEEQTDFTSTEAETDGRNMGFGGSGKDQSTKTKPNFLQRWNSPRRMPHFSKRS